MAKPTRRGKVWGVQISVAGWRESATIATYAECINWQARRKVQLKTEATERCGDVHSLGEALQRYVDEVAPSHRGERWESVRIAHMLRELPVTLALANCGTCYPVARLKHSRNRIETCPHLYTDGLRSRPRATGGR